MNSKKLITGHGFSSTPVIGPVLVCPGNDLSITGDTYFKYIIVISIR